MYNKAIKQYLEYLKLSGIQDIFVKPPININKAELLQELEEKYHTCKKCALHTGRNKFCYGNGNPNARLLIIGEGPGADEDRMGEVFVGRSGQLLTKMLSAIKLSRDEVYIANIVKCRPPANRNPAKAEAAACRGYLDQQIILIQPKVILAVGAVAAHNLLQNEESVKQLRQRPHQYGNAQTPLLVTYHPAYLLRSPAQKSKVWEDLQKLVAIL